ncbi:hypothetical protein ACFLVH_01295 [Chloroflexota bacterium]
MRREQLEAWHQGKPFIDCAPTQGRLFMSMGFMPTERGEAFRGAIETQKYIEQGRTLGLPVENSCEQTYFALTMTESGDLPAESIVHCTQYNCTPMMLQKNLIAYRGKKLIYHFDIPFEENETNLEHLVNQFGEFIEFAEKIFLALLSTMRLD